MAKKYIKFEKITEDEWDVCSNRRNNRLAGINRSTIWDDRIVLTTDDVGEGIAYGSIEWTHECLQQIVDFLKEQENENNQD